MLRALCVQGLNLRACCVQTSAFFGFSLLFSAVFRFFLMSFPGEKNKRTRWINVSIRCLSTCSLRSEGDSNPRAAFGDYTLSRRASSATRASLLCFSECKVKNNFWITDNPPDYFSHIFLKPSANWLSGRKYHTLFRPDEKVVNNPTDNGSDENNYEYP